MTSTITTCPAWCTSHPEDDPSNDGSIRGHIGEVTVGAITVELESLDTDPAGGTQVCLPDLLWVNGQDLRDYIAALTKAADLLAAERCSTCASWDSCPRHPR